MAVIAYALQVPQTGPYPAIGQMTDLSQLEALGRTLSFRKISTADAGEIQIEVSPDGQVWFERNEYRFAANATRSMEACVYARAVRLSGEDTTQNPPNQCFVTGARILGDAMNPMFMNVTVLNQ